MFVHLVSRDLFRPWVLFQDHDSCRGVITQNFQPPCKARTRSRTAALGCLTNRTAWCSAGCGRLHLRFRRFGAWKDWPFKLGRSGWARICHYRKERRHLYISCVFCLVPFAGSLERKPDLRYIVILHHESESMSRIEDAGARPDNALHCITPRFTASCQSTDSAVLVDQQLDDLGCLLVAFTRHRPILHEHQQIVLFQHSRGGVLPGWSPQN
jgi:hypothetical protein